MTEIMPWLERKFSFDQPKWMYPNVVERLRGGPARLEDLLRDVPQAVLTTRASSSWSMQENAGHLVDIEALMSARLEQLMARVEVLQAWDGRNQATWEAEHNQQPIEEILTNFRRVRGKFVHRLEETDETMIEQAAFHPRLQKPMRTIDLVFFVAEHDDYHLARISALKRRLQAA